MSRYRSSVLGPARLFFNRLPMLAGYTVVFEAREGVTRARPISPVVLFVGQIIHGLFAEFANRAPGLPRQRHSRRAKWQICPGLTMRFLSPGTLANRLPAPRGLAS